jgi:outer membrane protein OmpA-like peptidoglycan-associated protein
VFARNVDTNRRPGRIPAKVTWLPALVASLTGGVAACGAPQNGAGSRPRVIVEGTSILIVDDSAGEKVPIEISFGVDSAVLDGQSQAPLDALAMFLADNADIALVEVWGHSDQRGTAEYNLELSKRRAEAVIAYLASKGIERSRLRGKGFGDRRPAATGANEAAWSQNRRVEFVIVEQRRRSDSPTRGRSQPRQRISSVVSPES